MGQGNSAWTVLIIPEMQSQFISREGKVVLLSERFPVRRDLPAWRCCFKVQRSIRRSKFGHELQTP